MGCFELEIWNYFAGWNTAILFDCLCFISLVYYYGQAIGEETFVLSIQKVRKLCSCFILYWP